MSDFKNKKQFERAFIAAVPNFSDTRIWFSHKPKMCDTTTIGFPLNRKSYSITLYKSHKEIEIWKNYFIDYLNTGNFDQIYYCQLFTENIDNNRVIDHTPVSEIHEFEFNFNKRNEFKQREARLLPGVIDLTSNAPLRSRLMQVPKPSESIRPPTDSHPLVTELLEYIETIETLDNHPTATINLLQLAADEINALVREIG